MSVIELSTSINDLEEYEPLPAGQYRAEVRDVEVKHSEKVPHGYFVVSLLVPVENFPADYDASNAPEGLPLTYARLQVPHEGNRKNAKPFKNFIRALNLPTESSKIDTADWIGREVTVLISVGQYQGAPVNNVEAIMPVADL